MGDARTHDGRAISVIAATASSIGIVGGSVFISVHGGATSAAVTVMAVAGLLAVAGVVFSAVLGGRLLSPIVFVLGLVALPASLEHVWWGAMVGTGVVAMVASIEAARLDRRFDAAGAARVLGLSGAAGLVCLVAVRVRPGGGWQWAFVGVGAIVLGLWSLSRWPFGGSPGR